MRGSVCHCCWFITKIEENWGFLSKFLAAFFCVLQGNVRFLKLLLSRRANWLQKDLEEMTPLHLATRHPSPKALALLLKHIGPGEVDTQDKNKVLECRYAQISCWKIVCLPNCP